MAIELEVCHEVVRSFVASYTWNLIGVNDVKK